jgi:hypothetical protein|nr:MAG: hypothetical protein [Bacteriophage sp.]DAG98842.1 MAG TPA: hypothetical protein [Herelleviridae sp.]
MKIEDIEKRSLEYAEITAPTYANGDFESTIADAFEHGANWRINSVWHEVSEEPERNRIYLAQLGDCAFDTFYDSENWVKFSRGVNMQRWAYVEDLLPNK